MLTQSFGRRMRPFVCGVLVLSSVSVFVSGVAGQGNGNGEIPDSVRAAVARADSLRAQLVQPPGEYGGIRAMDVIRMPFQLFGATMALGLTGAGAGYYLLDKTVLQVGRQARSALSDIGVDTDFSTVGTRSWPALVLRYEGLSPFFAEVGYSLRQYQHYSAGVRQEGEVLVLEAAGTYRRMRQPHFWGVGPDSREEDRSDFAQDVTDVSGTALWKVTDGLSLSADAGWERNVMGRGWDDKRPDLQDMFDAEDLFGLEAPVEYMRFGGVAELDETYLRNFQQRGLGASAELHHYEGVGGTSSAFQRVAGSARFFLPVNERTSIALRLLAEDHLGERGAGVPFTHLARLGGDYGLRGESGRRYRDLAMAAGQLEWRYEAYWHPGFSDLRLEGFAFVDAGNVGPSLSAISGVHVTPGFGFRFLDGGRSRAEVHFGFGGDDARIGFQMGSTF